MSTTFKIFKPSRTVRLLTHYGDGALIRQPSLKGYRGGLISSKKSSSARKRSIVEGTFGEFSPLFGGWKENWDDAPKFFALKAGKGHIRERSRSLRADKITKAMKSMPDKIAKYRQEVASTRPPRTILNHAKWVENQYDMKYRRYSQFTENF